MSSNLNKIETIEDMKESLEVMNAFGLPTKGISTLDEMKTTLSKHLNDLEGTSTRKVGEVSTQPPIFVLQNEYKLVSRYQLMLMALNKCCLVRQWFAVVLALQGCWQID